MHLQSMRYGRAFKFADKKVPSSPQLRTQTYTDLVVGQERGSKLLFCSTIDTEFSIDIQGVIVFIRFAMHD